MPKQKFKKDKPEIGVRPKENAEFWKGNFGDRYISRNIDPKILASNIGFFGRVFSQTNRPKTLIEFGPNIGYNLRAIQKIIPEILMTGVEINESAVDQLKSIPNLKVIHSSVLDYKPKEKFDCVLVKGLLIHINPRNLDHLYETIYRSTKRYVCIAEYFNPTPVTIPYRGHKNKLFKRDFAQDMLKKFPDLQLVDYGFFYHLDPLVPQDDLNWFLLQK